MMVRMYEKGGQVTKLKLLYVIQVVKKILVSNFLALADIKVFGRTYIAIYNAASDCLTLFLHPGCFCLAYHYFLEV